MNPTVNTSTNVVTGTSDFLNGSNGNFYQGFGSPMYKGFWYDGSSWFLGTMGGLGEGSWTDGVVNGFQWTTQFTHFPTQVGFMMGRWNSNSCGCTVFDLQIKTGSDMYYDH
jgi:hypothetical protein